MSCTQSQAGSVKIPGLRAQTIVSQVLSLALLFSLCMIVPCRGLTTDYVRLAVDIDVEVGGVDFDGQDAISKGATKPAPILVLDFAGSEKVGIDALMVFSNLIIFSGDTDFSISGTPYADEDLVAYNANATSYSMYFDGSVYELPRRVNLDAACLAPGTTTFLFSVDVHMTLPDGTPVDGNDVLQMEDGELDLVGDGATLFGLPAGANIDALYFDETRVFYSLNIPFRRGGDAGTDDDVWIYNTTNGVTRLMQGMDIEARADLAALDTPIDSDGDWLSDFEEITGLDEAATTFPDTAYLLGPNGYISDPHVVDTDGDGLTDGAEGASGTDPDDDTQYLHITAIEGQGPAKVVTWTSVSNKVYDLQAAVDLVGTAGTTVADDYDSQGASTSYTNASGEDVYIYRVMLEPGL